MLPERPEPPRPVLADMKALITGVANEHSIAYGCAKAFRELGADLAITYATEKRSASWSTSWTSASPARFSPRRTRGGFRVNHCMSMAAWVWARIEDRIVHDRTAAVWWASILHLQWTGSCECFVGATGQDVVSPCPQYDTGNLGVRKMLELLARPKITFDPGRDSGSKILDSM